MSAAQYEECIKLLKKAGAGNPAGRSYHAAFGPKDKLMVFDVWTSQAAFDKFGKTLMPILQQLGLDPGQPSVMPVHKVIVPTAKVTSSTKQAKASARRQKRWQQRCVSAVLAEQRSARQETKDWEQYHTLVFYHPMGSATRLLTMIDEFTRECLAIRVPFWLLLISSRMGAGAPVGAKMS
jgi:hypothetical protein